MDLPERYGRYQIKRILGKGGMATVYLAHDPRFGRDVALKAVATGFNDDPTFRNRFEREARTIATLEHPSIVPVYDFGEDNGQLYLVMRHMPNGTLADRIILGPLDGAKAIPIIRRIADALDHAHQNGVIHRDLKPGNILFDEYERAYLSDFGIVKLAAEGTQADLTGSGVIGTPAYMSPEQIHGDEVIDGRSDIYTLGVILFEMLTGRKPYRADTPVKQMMAHVMEPIPDIAKILPNLSQEAILVLQKALAKEKESRYQKAQELTAELTTTVTGQNFTPIARSEPVEPIDHDSDTISEELETLTNIQHIEEETRIAQSVEIDPLEQDDQTVVSKSNSSLKVLLWVVPIIVVLGLAGFFVSQNLNQPEGEETAIPEVVLEPTDVIQNDDVLIEEETAVPIEPTTIAESANEEPTATIETPSHNSLPAQGSIGFSTLESEITYEKIGDGANQLLIVGGIHAGFAPSSIEIVQALKSHFQENSELLPNNLSIIFISNINPDSVEGSLLNPSGVDLDRNWDCDWSPNALVQGVTTAGIGGELPFSEAETAVLQSFIVEQREISSGQLSVLFFDAGIQTGWVSAGGCGEPSLTSKRFETLFSSSTNYLSGDVAAIQGQTRAGKAIDWLDANGIPAIMIWLPDTNAVDFEPNLEGVLAIIQQFSN